MCSRYQLDIDDDEGMLWDVTLRQSRNADVTVKVRSCDERGRIKL